MAHITFKDRPCGYGKSTSILRSFDKREKYITVVPFLSEVDRYVKGAQEHGFTLTQPLATKGNKTSHCERLIRDGRSIVCTHSLFYRLGELATRPTHEIETVEFDGTLPPKVTTRNFLGDYNLIIDEVIDPLKTEPIVRAVDLDRDYVGLGLARIMENGRVAPTELWDMKHREGSKTFNRELYEKAKSGALYRLSDDLFILTIPVELLLRPKSVTIYTYLSDGSLCLKFLEKLQAQDPGSITVKVDRLDPAAEAEWRRDVANALTVKSIPELERHRWNYSGQLKDFKSAELCRQAGWKLRRFSRDELSTSDLSNVMLTCARENWYASRTGEKPVSGRLAKHSRLFGRPTKRTIRCSETDSEIAEWGTTGVNFVPNTTRGTNDHAHCTRAVYLYDQNPNPVLITFLGWKRDSAEARRFCDAYALTELVQWLFRSAIRRGGINGTGRNNGPRQRVTVYIPSERMRNLLVNWLVTGEVYAGPPKGRSEVEKALVGQLMVAA